MSRRYSAEQVAFLRSFIPGHYWHETADAYEAKFGERLTRGMVNSFSRRYSVHTGLNGSAPGQGARYKVGDESVNSNGYTLVKVCDNAADEGANYERPTHPCWKQKHVIVWEQAHGRPVPHGCRLVFANRDKTDFDPENIVAVPKGLLMTMNAMGLQWYDRETLRACMTMAQIRSALHSKRKKAKEVCR